MTMTERVKRMKPQRGTRVLLIYLPVFSILTLLALRIAGLGYEDLRAYAMELAPRSMYAVAILGLAAGYMRLTGMDLPNAERARYQRILLGEAEGDKLGAFAILAGESLAWSVALLVFAAILLVWQG